MEKVEEELKRLQDEGTIEPVENIRLGSTNSPSAKKGQVSTHLWGFSANGQFHFKMDNYPIPKIDNLLVQLKGGTLFTKLEAYLQIPLDDKSKKFVVINTHKDI